MFAREGGDATLQHHHIYDEPPALRELVKGYCPIELEQVIYTCLARHVDDRPANARVLAARLRAIEIPDEDRWSEPNARAWWNSYKPEAPADLAPADVQMIMPGLSRDSIPTILDRP